MKNYQISRSNNIKKWYDNEYRRANFTIVTNKVIWFQN